MATSANIPLSYTDAGQMSGMDMQYTPPPAAKPRPSLTPTPQRSSTAAMSGLSGAGSLWGAPSQSAPTPSPTSPYPTSGIIDGKNLDDAQFHKWLDAGNHDPTLIDQPGGVQGASLDNWDYWNANGRNSGGSGGSGGGGGGMGAPAVSAPSEMGTPFQPPAAMNALAGMNFGGGGESVGAAGMQQSGPSVGGNRLGQRNPPSGVSGLKVLAY